MSQTRPDPSTLPEWKALHREASLVRQIIGTGVTALGRASYGSGFGEYYAAFFGLSVGVERLMKLILVADYAIENAGALPGQRTVHHYGHDLKKLCERADQIAIKHGLSLDFSKPSDPICWAVIDCLDAFANAAKGRYANFEAIGNPNFDAANEPVNKWWSEVVELILDKHYRGRAAERGVQHYAENINTSIGNISSVLFLDENGRMMTDLQVASERSGHAREAQKYGRFYTLCVVRWLSDIFCELVHQATCQNGIDVLFGHDEFFYTYRAKDSFLLTRKLWPLT